MNTSDQRTQDLLEQILIWTRASSFSSVEAMLKQALPADKDRNAYQAMDPDAENKEVARRDQEGISDGFKHP